MADDYAGPDRRAQSEQLAEAVDVLDQHVVSFTVETKILRQEVATERRWRRVVVAVVAVLVPLVAGVGYTVWQNRQSIAILRAATSAEAQGMTRYGTAVLICDLKIDTRIAIHALHPESVLPPPANCPPTPPTTKGTR